jgi:hypothetical protein
LALVMYQHHRSQDVWTSAHIHHATCEGSEKIREALRTAGFAGGWEFQFYRIR